MSTVPQPQFVYRASLIRVVDGDTLRFSVSLGLWIYHEVTVRLLGLNCPEVVGVEKVQGLASKAYVESVAPVGTPFIIQTHLDSADRYGRLLADAYFEDGRHLNQMLLDGNYAAPYDGHGPRPIPAPTG